MRSLEQILLRVPATRSVFGARGEVLLFDPVEVPTHVTNTSGVAERYPVISPDNRSVAYVSDEGENTRCTSARSGIIQSGRSIEQQPSFYWGRAWSPTQRKLHSMIAAGVLAR